MYYHQSPSKYPLGLALSGAALEVLFQVCLYEAWLLLRAISQQGEGAPPPLSSGDLTYCGFWLLSQSQNDQKGKYFKPNQGSHNSSTKERFVSLSTSMSPWPQ